MRTLRLRHSLRRTGENDNADLFKDPAMLNRLVELQNMETSDKSHILHVLDGFIKSVKLKNIAAL
jgi:hypothetical protein